jgi:hypothetical protein
MGMMGKRIGAEAGPPGVSDMGDEPDGDEAADNASAEESAAAEFQHAVKSGSAADVVEAFRKLKDICESEY